jgi:hypothetical protein
MTPEEAFIKSAQDRFEELKMASVGAFLGRLGGMQGLRTLATGGASGVMPALSAAYGGLDATQKARLIGQLGGAAAGAMLSKSDKDSPWYRRAANMALGAAGGAALGGMAASRIQGMGLKNMFGGSATPPAAG